MSENPENAFAEEAQEEALLSRTESLPGGANGRKNAGSLNKDTSATTATETSPLIPSENNQRHEYRRAANSYERALNEPWTGAHGAGNLPWWKTPSIFWLMPAFFPFCVAFGGLIVPRTYLILDLICNQYLSEKAAGDPNFRFFPTIPGQPENPMCQDWHVQQRTARFNTYIDLLSGLFSAIVSPHLGALSDRIGRKKVIIWASVGALISEIIYIVVGTYPDTVSVYWLLVGALTDGLCGSFTLGMMLAFSYGSDCSSPQQRAVVFGYFQAVLFTGISLGPIFAGWLINYTGHIMSVFWVALGCHLFFITFTTLFVPESLSKERQQLAQEKWKIFRADNPTDTIIQFFKVYAPFSPLSVLRPKGPGSSPALRRNIVLLAVIDMLMFGVAMGTMRIILIYAKYRFLWDPVEASMFMSVVNINRVLGLALLLPLLSWCFRGSMSSRGQTHRGADKLDLGIIRASLIFELLGYIGYALTPSGTLMVVSGLVASVGGVGSPTLASSITKHVPAERTGQVLGATGLLHALARVLAPLIFNTIYGQTVQYYSGIVFLCLASVFVVAFVLSWLLKPHLYLDETASSGAEQDSSSAPLLS